MQRNACEEVTHFDSPPVDEIIDNSLFNRIYSLLVACEDDESENELTLMQEIDGISLANIGYFTCLTASKVDLTVKYNSVADKLAKEGKRDAIDFLMKLMQSDNWGARYYYLHGSACSAAEAGHLDISWKLLEYANNLIPSQMMREGKFVKVDFTRSIEFPVDLKERLFGAVATLRMVIGLAIQAKYFSTKEKALQTLAGIPDAFRQTIINYIMRNRKDDPNVVENFDWIAAELKFKEDEEIDVVHFHREYNLPSAKSLGTSMNSYIGSASSPEEPEPLQVRIHR